LVKGDRLAKRNQQEDVEPPASKKKKKVEPPASKKKKTVEEAAAPPASKKKKKKVEEAAAVHDLCNDDEGKAVSRRSSRIEIQARNPGAAVLLHFPSRDAKGYISLTFADVQRLKSGAHGAPSKTLLLNDNLVDFYIKYLSGPPQQLCAKFIPGLDEKSRSRVHMFVLFVGSEKNLE
jgi:Ulp1 family protease